MPKNPDLIPTVVTDKNGRITTVHRKPTGMKTSARIPAPAVKVPAKHKKRAAAALEAMGMDAPTDSQITKNMTYLAERAPLLVNDIVERCTSCSDTEWQLWNNQLDRRMFSDSSDPMTNEYPLYELRARLELFDTAEQINKSQGPQFQSPAGIDYLIVKASEASYEAKLDWHFAKVRMVMNNVLDGNIRDIHDATFTPEIFNRLPRLLEIIPELRKRGANKADSIIMLMDSDSGVLIDGEL